MNSSRRREDARDAEMNAGAIVDSAFGIHSELGPGLLESVDDVIWGDALAEGGFSVESLVAVHTKPLVSDLRLPDFRLGLLMNFGAPLLKDGVKRIVNGLESTKYSQPLRAFAFSREIHP